jgi:predicted nucleic acid-binding protein
VSYEKVKNGEFDIYISNIVFREIARAPQEKEALLLNLIDKHKPKELEINEEVLELAQKYIKEAALPGRAIDDSRHAAVATVYEIDALISWNLKHLANLRRMERINGINLKEGYSKRLEIVTPMEVSND